MRRSGLAALQPPHTPAAPPPLLLEICTDASRHLSATVSDLLIVLKQMFSWSVTLILLKVLGQAIIQCWKSPL